MRSFFKGVLGFGLVAIPVQLFRALEPERVAFHWVHRSCGSRIQYQKVCPVCQRPVEAEELARGAETDDGRLVLVEADDLKDVQGRRDALIQLVSFHPQDSVDLVYFGDPYWAKPGSGGLKPYRLLWRALRDLGRVGVAEMTLARRPRLALLRPYPTGALMLHAMRYPEHVRQEGAAFGGGSEADAVRVSDEEERLAHVLVQQLEEPFRPERYVDRVGARLRQLIAERADAARPEGVPAAVQDLVAQLRASVREAETVGEGRP